MNAPPQLPHFTPGVPGFPRFPPGSPGSRAPSKIPDPEPPGASWSFPPPVSGPGPEKQGDHIQLIKLTRIVYLHQTLAFLF